MCIISSNLFCLSSSPLGRGIAMPPTPMPILSNEASNPPMPSILVKAAVEGLSKFMGAETPRPDCPALLLVGAIMAAAAPAFAGDFLTCWGEDFGPWGEKAACRFEKGVEADAPGVAAAY